MPFNGFPEYVTDAMQWMGVSRVREDGTRDPHGERIWELAVQSQALRHMSSLLGQASDDRNPNRLATLAVVKQHLTALRATAYAAGEAVAAVEDMLGIVREEPEPTEEQRQPTKQAIKKRA